MENKDTAIWSDFVKSNFTQILAMFKDQGVGSEPCEDDTYNRFKVNGLPVKVPSTGEYLTVAFDYFVKKDDSLIRVYRWNHLAYMLLMFKGEL